MHYNDSLISIIVPVYKVEKYLSRCIDSILAQTYQNIEVILVDDGSPDRCGEICEEYAQKDSRIKVIHQENQGVNAARRNGFVNSIGEWIMFVDSDDTITPNAVEVLLLHANGMDLVSGSVVIYRDDSNTPETFPNHIQEVGEYDGYTFLNQLFERKRLCSLWRQLIKRSILSEDIMSLSSEIKFSEDFIINMRMGLNIKYAKGIPDIVYEYHYYQGNAVTSFQMTCEYMDKYDAELTKRLPVKQSNLFSNQLYCYRLNTILDYLSVKNIQKTQMASSLLSEKRGKKISIRNRYGLLLLYIPSCKLRSFFFKLYGKLARWTIKWLGYGNR